jgi:ABC-2 type transport system permease protein
MRRLRAELRAFAATARKEWLITRRYPMTFVTAVFWPLVLPPFYLFEARGFAGDDPRALAAFADRAGTLDIAAFLYVGWAVSNWLSIVLWGPGTSLRREQVRGSLESMFLAPTSRLVLLLGPAPAHLLVALWTFGVVGVTMWLGFGVPLDVGTIVHALVVIVLATPVLFGIGALFSTLVLRLQDASALVQATRGLFTIFCGITYPIAVLPAWGQVVARALPPTYVLASLRDVVLAGTGLARMAGSLLMLAVLGVLVSAAAVAALAGSERHARRTGRLGQF